MIQGCDLIEWGAEKDRFTYTSFVCIVGDLSTLRSTQKRWHGLPAAAKSSSMGAGGCEREQQKGVR